MMGAHYPETKGLGPPLIPHSVIDEVVKGRYLITWSFCRGCHVDNDKGQIIATRTPRIMLADHKAYTSNSCQYCHKVSISKLLPPRY